MSTSPSPVGVAWPSASIDGVTSVELLAQRVGSPRIVRRVIDAPIDIAWSWLANIETSIPAFDRTVHHVNIHDRTADLVLMTVKSPFLPALPFRCHFGDHHLAMTGPARLYTVILGVSALGPNRTLYVQCEAIPRRLGRLAARLIARHVNHDANEVKRLIEATHTLTASKPTALPVASVEPTDEHQPRSD